MTPALAETEAEARFAVSIGGKVYGPYAQAQMRGFITEGRIRADSVISRDNGPWIAASAEPAFGGLFTGHSPTPVPVNPAPAPSAPAESSLSVRDSFLRELQGMKRGPDTPSPEPAVQSHPIMAPQTESANFLIIFEMKTRGSNKLEEAIAKLGTAARIASNVWILNGPYTAATLRNKLIEHFGKTDSLFLVDATRDKLAWFNFGPEADAHFRRVWKRS